MDRIRANPHLLEINTRVWLSALSRKHGKALTLMSVPDEEWDAIHRSGFDAVWLMGVWKPSPMSRKHAQEEPGLRKAYDEFLPGWKNEDVGGSPYAIHGYELNPALGPAGDLHKLKKKLNDIGLRLFLDFVSNHMAADHPWTKSHPERFVNGSAEDLERDPVTFFSPKPGVVLAHGKDPNFPAWTDTAQLNYFNPDTRREMIETLKHLARIADGVRCDVAMLLLNDVHESVWGTRLLREDWKRPQIEFWTEALAAAKDIRSDFLFIAEVYWGLEWKLQELGFDYTYDKVLYDRLVFMGALEVRGHLWADEAYQRRSARFIENHDEPRAMTAFGRDKSLAAATIAGTLKGMRLFHEGQMKGWRIKLPVQLARGPDEPGEPEVAMHYQKMLGATKHAAFHGGEWTLLEAMPAAEGDRSSNSLLAWCWRQGRHMKLVCVNYSDAEARGRVKLPVSGTGDVQLVDELTGEVYNRTLSELKDPGLFVDLNPWKCHLLSIPL